ncbi:hypothetical protein Tco_0888960 [Tanacetum coccineum]
MLNDERVALANLIANLKLDVDENKKIQKQLKKANASLAHELKECKSILEETSRTLRESNSIRDSCLLHSKIKYLSLRGTMALNNRIVDYEKLERKLNETLGLLAQKDIDIKEGLKLKAYEISVVKEKHDELVKQSLLTKSHFEGLVKEKEKVITNLKLKEEKYIDKMISMEKQLRFLNEIIYKRNQSIQTIHMLAPKGPTFNDLQYFQSLEKEIDELESDKADFSNIYDLLLQECVSKDVMCSYLHSLSDLDAHTELQCLYLHKIKECECLAEKLSKQTENFDKPSVVRQPNAQRIPKPSVLGKPAPFSDSLERKSFSKTKSVTKTNVSEGMYQIDTRTTQTKTPQLPQTSRNINPCVSTSTGVIHNTSVSRPQLRSTQMKEKVLLDSSQVKSKKMEVEDHHRISSISNKTKLVTACNDSLKVRTSNVYVVCVTCGKCVFNSNHDACVSKFINDVNARTKKPKVVSISTKKPKSQVNKSVATPNKKTVASDSTIQKSKSYFRMLYENTNKAWKWWIEKQCPS